MAIIEIDPSSPWPPDSTSRPPRARRHAARAVAVFAGVLLLLSGPWLGQSGGLRPAWLAEVAGGFFWLTPDAVYTIDQVGGGLALSRRDPADGAVRWRQGLLGPLAQTYASRSQAMVARFPPTLNLDVNTMVIDTQTGDVVRGYPASAMPLVYLAGDLAITVDRDPAAGPDPPLPELSLSVTGLDRPHLVVARDLATGAVRWTLRLPVGVSWSLPGVAYGTEGIVGLPSGQEWMVTSNDDGDIDAWDLRTGAKLATRDVGPFGIDSYVTALESTVVVRIRGTNEVVMTGYDPRTLVQAWRINPPAIYANPFECGDLLCLQTDRAVWAMDRDRGVLAWRVEQPRVRPSIGPASMLVNGFGDPLSLIDPVHGGYLPADNRWRVADLNQTGSTVVLARPDSDGAGAQLGLLDPVDGATARLGEIGVYSPATQCLAVPGYVACEDGGLLRLYHR